VVTTETVTGTGGTTTSQTVTYMVPKITQQNIGFVLDVTPSVGRDLRHIVLELIPNITDVEGGTEAFGKVDVIPTASSKPISVEQPIIKTQTLNTRLVTSDGDLVVIGGLMGQNTTKQVKKVPVLGDIPLLGYLFRHTTDTISKTHLIIVVKAQIIDPSGRTYTDGNGRNGAAAAAPRKEPVEGPFFTYPEPAGAAAAGK
jgi:type II secretory pathway component GspD/PulD (secretin)